ncbi:hypothetical protein PAPYR_3829 [Paratrimastix pyriformis]|uniref:Etoposide-induced protein 2.4-domain-containing protein n=1 Tax=Paratrimastix pyriformis TaxID=342808 RepID=A0ABQ8UPA2_9EUKA|nr:hypothetical protein PAPYR_3829 [Paratrimastix pyriformis]
MNQAAEAFRGVTVGIKNALAYQGFLRVFSSPKIRKLLINAALSSCALGLVACFLNFYYRPWLVHVALWFGSENKTAWGALVRLFFALFTFGTAVLPWQVATFQIAGMFCRKITNQIVDPDSPPTPSEKKPFPRDPIEIILMALNVAIGMIPIITVILELSIIHAIPYVGMPLEIISRSLYYSYTIWSFKWAVVERNRPGTSVAEKMTYLERNWPYYVGYSLPLVLLTTFLPAPYVGTWTYGLVLPIWVILTHYVRVIPTPSSDVDEQQKSRETFGQTPFPMPLFTLPVKLQNRATAAYRAALIERKDL